MTEHYSMSSQQSWAAWLLDSYASSVSPVTESSTDRHQDDGPHSSEEYSSASAPSSSNGQNMSSSNWSPYGPYLRTGRGGAGNFAWQSNAPAQWSDLEAQKQSSLSERRKAAQKLERIDTAEAMGRKSSAQYLHMGRGGAGNYAHSIDIQSASSPSLPKLSPSAVPVHPGRGGAGNFAAAAEVSGRVESEKELEDRLAMEKRREKIEEQVDGFLQPPPGAWLGARRPSNKMLKGVEY